MREVACLRRPGGDTPAATGGATTGAAGGTPVVAASSARANSAAEAYRSAGGHESTLLALYHTMYHWGSIVVTPGYAAETQQEAGTPYGATHVSHNGTVPPGEVELTSARFQGKRVTEVAKRLAEARVAA